jgi:hypothetical protein
MSGEETLMNADDADDDSKKQEIFFTFDRSNMYKLMSSGRFRLYVTGTQHRICFFGMWFWIKRSAYLLLLEAVLYDALTGSTSIPLDRLALDAMHLWPWRIKATLCCGIYEPARWSAPPRTHCCHKGCLASNFQID